MSGNADGFVLWFTGLSGAGKSTLARLVRDELTRRGRAPEVLDGDEVRTHLSKGLGFSKEDRDTNIRRIGYVAGLVARNGGAVIAAAISPYREIRDEVRARTPNFIEVYVRCSIEELARRDVKGLYAKALAGELPNFSGVSDPYEEPRHPELIVDSERETEAESLARILAELERRGLIPRLHSDRLLSGPEAEEARRLARTLPRIQVGTKELSDAYMLAAGALAPITGFMDSADHASVVAEGRLRGGQPFTIPVMLRVSEDDAAAARGAARAGLWREGRPVAVVDVAEVFRAERGPETLSVYGTDDPAHPGVAALMSQPDWAIAGDVVCIERPPARFPEFELTPAEVRRMRDERGWRTMVGFQTRNPVHRAHEYLTKVALEIVDGLLLHPLIGDTKDDDIPAAVRMRCYQELLAGYYPPERVMLATNPAWMRYAGPKEAVFHAIVRRNFGCTHFIVGRDHAGVGSYYDTYAAHRIFDQYAPHELGIEILRFEHAFHCTICGGMASTRTCPHPPEARSALSGTRVREMLRDGQTLPSEFTRPEVAEVLARSAVERSRPQG